MIAICYKSGRRYTVLKDPSIMARPGKNRWQWGEGRIIPLGEKELAYVESAQVKKAHLEAPRPREGCDPDRMRKNWGYF